MTNEEAVFCIFLMRFNLQPSQAIKIVRKWLDEHPTDSWGTLKHLLKEDKITVVDGNIKATSPKTSAENSQPVNKYRGVELPQKPSEQINLVQTNKKILRYRGQEYMS